MEQAQEAQFKNRVSFVCYMDVGQALECDTIGMPPLDPNPLQWLAALLADVNAALHEFEDVFGPVPPGLPVNPTGPVIPVSLVLFPQASSKT